MPIAADRPIRDALEMPVYLDRRRCVTAVAAGSMDFDCTPPTLTPTHRDGLIYRPTQQS